MGFVDEYGEVVVSVFYSDVLEDDGEFVYGGDDNFFAALDVGPEVCGTFGMGEEGLYLGEVFDGSFDLFVEVDAVGYDDDGVKDGFSVVLEGDKLEGKPGDAVTFAAARGVLDEVALAGAVSFCVGEEVADDGELVIPGEYLGSFGFFGVRVFGFEDLCVVFDDVGEFWFGEDVFPEVVGFDAVRVRGVSGAVVIAFVEGEELRCFSIDLGTHVDFVVVYGEVDDGPSEVKEEFTGVTVVPILVDGIFVGLAGEGVFEFAGNDRKTVEEDAEVKGEGGVPCGVVELAGYAEDVISEVLFCGDVVFGGEGGVEIDVARGVDLYAVSEDSGCSVFFDLTLNAADKLAAFFVVVEEVIGGEFVLLGYGKIAEESAFIDAGGFVVVVAGTLFVVVCGDKVVDDEVFKSAFPGVGWHCCVVVIFGLLVY